MAKISLSTTQTGYASTQVLNDNFDDIEAEFQNRVLYRDNPTGEPNTMQNSLDMNGYDIINIGNVSGVQSISASITTAMNWASQLDGTGTHSISSGYAFRCTEVSASSSVTACLILMTDALSGFTSGQFCDFIQIGLGPIKITGDSGVTVRYKGTNRTNGQYARVHAHYRGSDLWYLDGDLSAS